MRERLGAALGRARSTTVRHSASGHRRGRRPLSRRGASGSRPATARTARSRAPGTAATRRPKRSTGDSRHRHDRETERGRRAGAPAARRRSSRQSSRRPGGADTTGRRARTASRHLVGELGAGPRPVAPSSASGTPSWGSRTGSGRQACRRSSAKAAADPRSCGSAARPRPITASSSGGAPGASSARSGSRPSAATREGVARGGRVPRRDRR